MRVKSGWRVVVPSGTVGASLRDSLLFASRFRVSGSAFPAAANAPVGVCEIRGTSLWGVLIIRIRLFRGLGPPFSETPMLCRW